MIKRALRIMAIICCMYVVAKWPNLVVITCESGVTSISYLAQTVRERVANERADSARAD